MTQAALQFEVEPTGESSGLCDCCGRTSRTVWGYVHEKGAGTLAAYFVQWTESHLTDLGANVDLIVGKWGDDASPADRMAVSLLHREEDDGTPSLMVIDCVSRPVATNELVGSALARREVIDTPLAGHVFALIDAIYQQDRRFF